MFGGGRRIWPASHCLDDSPAILRSFCLTLSLFVLTDFQEGMANSAADIVSLAVEFDPAIVVPDVRADHKCLDMK